MSKRENYNAHKPAHPVPHDRGPFTDDGEPLTQYHDGLSKREYFAAMAMQGMLATDAMQGVRVETSIEELTAHASVCYADALIAELEKKE